MRQATHRITFGTSGRGLREITREVAAWLAEQPVQTGLLTLFCQHTSASLLIQENADPDVRVDLEPISSTSRRKRRDAISIRTKARTICRVIFVLR